MNRLLKDADFFQALGEATKPLDREDVSTLYHWTRKEIERDWLKKVGEGSTIIRSPALDFATPEEIDSIVIRLGEVDGMVKFTILWNDKPSLSRKEFLSNRKDITVPENNRGVVLIRGDDISDLGPESWNQAVRHVFLRFHDRELSLEVFSSISIVARRLAFVSQPLGWSRLALRGDVRDAVFMRAPGKVSYGSSIRRDSELLFGIHCLDRGATVRFRVMSGNDILFDKRLRQSTGWNDFRIPLSGSTGETQYGDATPEIGGETTLTFNVQSSVPGSTALWSNPAVVDRGVRHRPNVILYLIDTLRADRLSIYGYSRNTSPFIDDLSKKGVLFRNAYSNSSWTKPSIATLMTSLSPLVHQVGARTFGDVLPKRARTLAEYLAENGYITVNFSANPLGSTLSNLDQGFDYTYTPKAFQAKQEFPRQKVSSDDLNAKILPWLEAHASDTFFMYIHSMDPHTPYSQRRIPRHLASADSRTGLYDSEIYFNDGQIRRVYEKLTKLGIANDTIFILVSDHGEAFDDHGESGHGRSLYQEEVHIPFVIVQPQSIAPRVVDRPVQLADLMPTILKHCLIPYDPNALEGVDILDQRVLASRGRLFLARFMYPEDPDVSDFHTQEQYAVIEDNWKLIVKQQDKDMEFELYDLDTDPLEHNDLHQTRLERVKVMYSALMEFIKRQTGRRRAFLATAGGAYIENDLSVDVINRLRTLGYIQ